MVPNAQKALEVSGVGSWDGQAGGRASWLQGRGVGRGPAAARLAPYGRVCYGWRMQRKRKKRWRGCLCSACMVKMTDTRRRKRMARAFAFEVGLYS